MKLRRVRLGSAENSNPTKLAATNAENLIHAHTCSYPHSTALQYKFIPTLYFFCFYQIATDIQNNAENSIIGCTRET